MKRQLVFFACGLVVGLGCSDSPGGNPNPHGADGGPDAALSDAASDAAADAVAIDAAPALTCGATTAPVYILPASGVVTGTAPFGNGQMMGSCSIDMGPELIYKASVTQTLSSITFTTNLPQTTAEPTLYVRSVCDMDMSELGCET